MLLSGERLPRPTVGAQSDQDRDEDRIEYLPEQYYLDVGRCSLDEMVRVTAECVTRWAGYYRAYPLRQPELRREGLLPADDQARTALVIELIAWVIAAAGKAELAALALYRGEAPEGWLWDAHDGLPGVLILGRDEFAELQEHWHRRGFPRDLYYPASQRHTEIEPVARYGGVVRGYRHYTPRQWAHRKDAHRGALRVPSESDRAQQFTAACDRFLLALLLRIAELTEPGREHDAHEQEEADRLSRLRREVLAAARRARALSGSKENP